MIKIVIDGREHIVKPGDNLLATCIALGYDLPYFCYHPAMGSVGACRQCAVKKYKDRSDTRGRIVMSCMEPITNGLIISIEDAEAKKFRKSIVEGLMLNHPHDCPVCDEGGECHLQDMTVMTGHAYRRNDFKKRTYNNQYLGSFIHHEMNRCIQCYRCVRFYKDYAGGKDFDVFASRDNVFFGRHEDGVLENEFSGNLVEVCPTGVFTDKTSRKHYTRKWDLTNTPSICTHCSVGCNIIASERYGSLRRIMSRYNGAVNGYFLCDRGRFGYEFVNGDQRIDTAVVKLSLYEDHEIISAAEEKQILKSFIKDNEKIIGIGSPRASLESNYALLKLVGKDNFYSGVSSSEYSLTKLALNLIKDGPFYSPSLSEIGKADAIIIMGEDITNTAPMIALAVRQASRTVPVQSAVKAGIPEWLDNAVRDHIQDKRSPIVNAAPYSTKLDDISAFNVKAKPDDIASLGFQIAGLISVKEPASVSGKEQAAVSGDNSVSESVKDYNPAADNDLVSGIVEQLKYAKNPVVITGVHSGSAAVIQAAADVASALANAGKNTGLCIVLPESNSMGLAMMEGKALDEAIHLVQKGEGHTVVVLENDLYRRSSKEKIDNLLAKSKVVIALDHTQNATTSKAHIVLPVGTFAESEGTLVNNEGRAQRFYKAIPPGNSPLESWRLLNGWETLDDVIADMTSEMPVFEKIKQYLPDADFRIYNEKISRQTKRFSGRTAITVDRNVHEQKPPDDPDSPLTFSMEGTTETKPSSLVPYYWRPGWNSYQAMNFYLDRPDGSMKGGDPGIRLIEENSRDEHSATSFVASQIESSSANDERLVVPVYQIFGSEELSSMAPAVAERIPQPFVIVNSEDAVLLGKSDGELTKLHIENTLVEVVVKIDTGVPSGVLGLSVNLPGMEYFELPAKITLTKQKQ